MCEEGECSWLSCSLSRQVLLQQGPKQSCSAGSVTKRPEQMESHARLQKDFLPRADAGNPIPGQLGVSPPGGAVPRAGGPCPHPWCGCALEQMAAPPGAHLAPSGETAGADAQEHRIPKCSSGLS